MSFFFLIISFFFFFFFFLLFYVILLSLIFTKTMLLLSFNVINFFFQVNYLYFFMFRHVPEWSVHTSANLIFYFSNKKRKKEILLILIIFTYFKVRTKIEKKKMVRKIGPCTLRPIYFFIFPPKTEKGYITYPYHVFIFQSTEKKQKKENGQENRSFFRFSNFEVKFKNTKNTVNG